MTYKEFGEIVKKILLESEEIILYEDCPSLLGLENTENCNTHDCQGCWKRALNSIKQ